MNILIFSNSPERGFGYSVVADKVSEYLSRYHNVIYFGMQSIVPPHRKNNIINVGLRFDLFGADVLLDYIRAYDVNATITILDIWLPQTQYLRNIRNISHWIAHITINTEPAPEPLLDNCSYAHALVAPSRFVESMLSMFSNVYYIPHGVDTSIFKPNKSIKYNVRKQLGIEDKEFVALSVMRNKGYMKNFPCLFRAWKIFLENNEKAKRDAVLLVLSDPFEPEGVRLDILRSRLGMDDYIKFICFKPTENGITYTYEGDSKGIYHCPNMNFSRETMSELYNAADIHIVSSSGESFNLPTLEAMACGIPVIMGKNTTGEELVMDDIQTGLLADIAYEEFNPLLTRYKLVDYNSLAKCIEVMYKDKEFRKMCSNNAVKKARRYDWSFILPKWKSLVEAVEYVG